MTWLKRYQSWLYVVVQFSLIFAIAGYSTVWGGTWQNVLTVVGTVLGLWAIITMQLKVSIFPDVRSGQQLYTGGPYRFIRHPMYTAVLLVTIAWAMNRADWITLLLWLTLLNDLLLKLHYEERQLRARFPEYRAYMQRTKRLIPFLY